MALFVIEGCGDIGPAIAYQLFKVSRSVLITDHSRPAHSRRGMSFVDAYYQSNSQLDGVVARYFDRLPSTLPNEVIICSMGIEQLLDQFDVKVVINARMRKRDTPVLPNWKSKHHSLLIGLGPGFVSNVNCDVAIETAWGDHLGSEVTGPTEPLKGDPRPIDGLTRQRIDAYGRKIRILTMIDEFSRKCLTIHCARRIGSIQVIEQLANAMIANGIPKYTCSDNCPEFIAKDLRSWLSGIGVKTAYIEPGSPWENSFCESFNGTFRDNLLDGEIFYSLKEAQIIVREWVKHYNHERPHSALGYRPPAPQTKAPQIILNQPSLLQ